MKNIHKLKNQLSLLSAFFAGYDRQPESEKLKFVEQYKKKCADAVDIMSDILKTSDEDGEKGTP